MARPQRKGHVSKPVSVSTTARGNGSLDQDVSSISQPGTSAAKSSKDNGTKCLQTVDAYLGNCPILWSKPLFPHSYPRKLDQRKLDFLCHQLSNCNTNTAKETHTVDR